MDALWMYWIREAYTMDSGSNLAYGSATPLIEALIEFEKELEANRHSLSFDLGLIMEQVLRATIYGYTTRCYSFCPCRGGRNTLWLLTDFGLERTFHEILSYAYLPSIGRVYGWLPVICRIF